MSHRLPIRGAVLAIMAATLSLLASQQAAHAQYSFTYTSFDPPGTTEDTSLANYGSEARGVSASGMIAGDYATADGHQYGYIRNADGSYKTTSINFTGGTGTVYTEIQGINNAGYVTGYGLDSKFNFTMSFIYNANTNSFLSPQAGGAAYTLFNNVNEAGLVATVSYATEADADKSQNPINSFYNIATGQFTSLTAANGYLGSTFIQTVTSTGYLGNVIDSSGNAHGVLVNTTTGADIFFDAPGAVSTHTDSISANGKLIGGHYTDAAGTEHGFVYDVGGSNYYTTDFFAPTNNPVVYENLLFSNNDNSFVGVYQQQDGSYHSFKVTATAAPEPSVLALLAPGGIGSFLIATRRRRQKSSAQRAA